MQLKRFLPFTVLAVSFYWSSPLSGLKFLPIYEPLMIKAQKNSPPHIAFEEVLSFDKKQNQWSAFEKIKPIELAVQKNSPSLFAKKIELQEMVLKKNVELIGASDTPNDVASDNQNLWMDELSPHQARRLQEAHARNETLDQDWSVPQWSDMAKTALKNAGALTLDAGRSPAVFVSGTDSNGHVKNQVPVATVSFPENGSNQDDLSKNSANNYSEVASNFTVHVVGPLEVTGGLGFTNDHHIEIRRSDEGVLKELGRADLHNGLYNITVENTSGEVIARLVDKDGKILGEDSFRLSRLIAGKNKPLQGPKLKIAPRHDYAGNISGAYNRDSEPAPAQTRVTYLKGASEDAVKKDGLTSMDHVMKGSSTVVRAAAPKHLQTTAIVVSGQRFKMQLFPVSMIKALQEIVEQQRQITLAEPPTVIWGKVTMDGKALSGIDVTVESDPGLQPIYFNKLMIPDQNLKSTSDNGLFAFVDASPGFHSLLATRASTIVGYQNVIVENGSVAQGDIESTIRSDVVPLRLYDAFSGESKSGTVTMQSLQLDIEVKAEVTPVNLPHLSRLGLMRTQPEEPDYLAAHYMYNDDNAFLHVPLIRSSWLNGIRQYLRVDDHPTAGMVVGFVPDEDFEVYLAGLEEYDQRLIVYFDMQGRVLQNHKGIAGGGFVLFNVPEDTHEVVIAGNRSQKIASKVIPVDANSLTVLNFKE